MGQLELFGGQTRTVLDEAGCSIFYHPQAIVPALAEAAFAELLAGVEWRSERRMMYEREVDVPRLVSSFRVGGELPRSIAAVLPAVEGLAGCPFTSVGLNLYRDGRDSVAPHNDTLGDLAAGKPIALLSLGATRRMTIRSKALPRRVLDLDLEPGSLLVMSYDTQHAYDHGIPKTRESVGPRISAAFRVRRLAA